VQSGFALNEIEDMWLTPSLAPPFGSAVAHDSRHVGGFVSGRWSRRNDGGETALRLVAERSLFRELLVEEHRTTFDFDIQRTQHLGEAHEFVGGLSYRRSADDILGTSWFSATPGIRVLQWQSGFAQDEVRIRERLRVTVGAKVEHNDYTGWEFQPNVRGVFALSPSQSVWAAASRAVRLPSRAEADGAIWVATFAAPGVPLPQAVRFKGAGSLADSEVLGAREVGYRYRVGEQVSVDVAGFHNRYDGLIQLAVLDAPTLEMAPAPHVTVPMQFSNSGRATRSGVEVASEWRPILRVRLNGAYSWLGGGDARPLQPGFPVTDDAPERQSYIRAAISLPARVELDAAVRYVSALRATSVPSYITGDARIGFRLWRMNASVVGRNLMSRRHVEYVPELFALGRSAVERSVTFQVRVAR
jgi:iron complex outermembrane receptor protein